MNNSGDDVHVEPISRFVMDHWPVFPEFWTII